MKTDLLIQKLKHVMERARDLEEEYRDKHKGDAYYKRSVIIKEKHDDLVKKINQLGMGKLIVWEAKIRDNNDMVIGVKISLLDTFSREDVKNILKLRTRTPHIFAVKKIGEILMGQVYPK